MNITGPGFDLVSKLLGVAALRQRVIAQNIANVNTPEYQEREVAFEEMFAKHLKSGGDALAARPELVTGAGGVTRVDGNNVDIDQEMTALTKNNLMYSTLAQILASQVGDLRSAITGR